MAANDDGRKKKLLLPKDKKQLVTPLWSSHPSFLSKPRMLSRSVALALVGSAAAFSPMMSMDLGRRSIVQAGAASAVAAPLLRPQEAQAGLPVDALCAGKACNSAPVLPSPPSWPNVRCHSWPRTEVVYSLHWPGHHHLRSPRVQARGAERGVHRRSCRRRGRRDVRQGMIPAMATGVLVFDLLN